MRSEPLLIERDDAVFALRRISDNELHRLRRHAVAVQEDPIFWMQRDSRLRRARPLSLAEFFVAMSRVFGGSGFAFDDYKSSFCFPFHLTTVKGTARGEYLLLVQDWKGGLNPRLYRCDRSSFAPIEKFVDSELSRDDYRYMMNFLDGFLGGYLEAIAGRLGSTPQDATPDFVNAVRAAFMLYGYREGKPFEQSFEEEGAYSAALGRVPSEIFERCIGETL